VADRASYYVRRVRTVDRRPALLRRGTPVETVAKLLGHSVVQTTERYGHLTVEDARRKLEAVGWLPGREVRL